MKRFNQLATGTILGTIVLSLVIDWLKSAPLLSTIKFVGEWIWNKLIAILSYAVQMWIVLLIIIGLILLYGVLRYITTERLPSYINYSEAIFRKWQWRWTYKKSNDGEWIVDKLVAFCPKDDTQLIMISGREMAYCPDCQTEFPTSDIPYERDYEIRNILYKNLRHKFPNETK